MNARILIFILGLPLLAACSGKSEPPAGTRQATAESATQQAAAPGMELAVAGPADIRQTLPLYGSIRPNAERRQEVRARYPGVVRSVGKHPGDAVARGDELLSIESNDSLEPYPLRSPIAGTVLERRTNPGEAVDGSQTLLVIADLSTVWAEFAVFARDLAQVRAGMAIQLKADSGQQAEARIAYVAPAGGEQAQSVVARVVLDNRDRRWVPGQFVTGEVVVAQVSAAVSVAPGALQQVRGEPVVFVQGPKGIEPRPVQIGHRGTDAVEIVKGLNAGERYVAKGSFLAKAEALKSEAEED